MLGMGHSVGEAGHTTAGSPVLWGGGARLNGASPSRGGHHCGSAMVCLHPPVDTISMSIGRGNASRGPHDWVRSDRGAEAGTLERLVGGWVGGCPVGIGGQARCWVPFAHMWCGGVWRTQHGAMACCCMTCPVEVRASGRGRQVQQLMICMSGLRV